MKTLTIYVAAFLFSSNLWADSLDLNLHDNAFRFTYASFVDKKTVADFGALFLQERNNRQSDALIHTGVNFVFDQLRFGLRAAYASPGPYDVLSLGFGGQGRFFLSRRVGIGGHFYYAPEATSGMDSAGYHEFAARLKFKLTRGVYVYGGYRNLKVKIVSPDNKVELDDDFHVGLKLFF